MPFFPPSADPFNRLCKTSPSTLIIHIQTASAAQTLSRLDCTLRCTGTICGRQNGSADQPSALRLVMSFEGYSGMHMSNYKLQKINRILLLILLAVITIDITIVICALTSRNDARIPPPAAQAAVVAVFPSAPAPSQTPLISAPPASTPVPTPSTTAAPSPTPKPTATPVQ